MGYIFLITNTADGNKGYVGYSRRRLSQVRASYYTQARHDGNNRGSALFEAIRAFPNEVFLWSILADEIEKLDDLIRQRIFYIDRLGTADPQVGYNVRDGISVEPGLVSKMPPRFVCVETGELFHSTYEIQAVSGMTRQQVAQHIRNGQAIRGRIYRALPVTGDPGGTGLNLAP